MFLGGGKQQYWRGLGGARGNSSLELSNDVTILIAITSLMFLERGNISAHVCMATTVATC